MQHLNLSVEHVGAIKRLVGGYGQRVSERHLLVIKDKVVVYAGGYAVFSGKRERCVERLTEQVGHAGQAVHVELEVTIVVGLNLHGDGVGHGWLPFVEFVCCVACAGLPLLHFNITTCFEYLLPSGWGVFSAILVLY